jgi:alanyl-tRNA synthetase
MKGSQIRRKFLEFFEKHGHTVLPSSSLIPRNDPTLLFTNAGMVQFKDIFTGVQARSVARAVTSQKCLRAGGKHNDLENVGRTARHHTFFEMLGNFSFGDYFKEEAIRLAWDFLVRELGLPKERLWVSVFHDDDEAFQFWEEKIRVPGERILRLGEKDNFWAMGDTGPCGPCSEIHVDQGPQVGCGGPECSPECDCDRYLEIWNLVFMQFSRDASGQLTPLPAPSIDTGMGLERVTAVVQGVASNYDTDLFQGVIAEIADLAGQAYGASAASDTSIRVIADHVRALTFLFADGVLPSNEGRGYVARRILRRAARHGKMLNLDGAFLYRLSGSVVDEMQEAYPELRAAREHVAVVIQNEEERFLATLDQGLTLLSDLIEKLKQQGERVLPGAEIFKLYDTFGFPVDLTEDIAREKDFVLDTAGFEREMAQQKRRARASWKGSDEKGVEPVYQQLSSQHRTTFVGYERIESSAKLVAVIQDGRVVDSAGANGEVAVVLEPTPFYAEAGGQVGDRGRLAWEGGAAEVLDAFSPAGALVVHRVRILQGILRAGQSLTARVSESRRRPTALNHTATHILHAVLRQVLGDHVKQAGSLVAPDRLRFDFTHFAAVKPRELQRIERLANERVWRNATVQTAVKPLDEALADGAMALFGEKYGDAVRLVSIPDLSKELCGGTHVRATGEIGLIKVLHEGGIAAGVRRIEAVTGEAAYDHYAGIEAELRDLSERLKVAPGELAGKVEKLLQERKDLLREVSDLKREMAEQQGQDLSEQIRDVDGVKVLAHRMDRLSPEELREFADRLRDQLGSGVVVAGSEREGKVALVAMVSRDLDGKVHAGHLIRDVARITGGGGGGRSDMAQAGGKDPSRLDDALEKVVELVRDQIAGG